MQSSALKDPQSLLNSALAETRNRFSKTHRSDLMIAEFQLKYLAKALSGTRRNREKLIRTKLNTLAKAYDSEDSKYAELLSQSQKIADMLLEKSQINGQ